jgi:hypothetical protein
LRWDRRISYYGLLDVKVVVQIAFTVLGRIFLQMTPWCTMYSISVPLLSPVPTPVSEPSSQIPFPPNEADNDDGGQGFRRWHPSACRILSSRARLNNSVFCFCGWRWPNSLMATTMASQRIFLAQQDSDLQPHSIYTELLRQNH